MAQFVYTMHRVGKVVPPKRHILKTSLSFFPGQNWCPGLNGAGKSTLLRIMAGIDKDIEGEARPQPDIKIGYLPQEPQLNPEHTVRESIEEAVSEVVNALKRRMKCMRCMPIRMPILTSWPLNKAVWKRSFRLTTVTT